jgi:ABC-type multidrug transport system fused ATPase/permease subunit
VPKPKAYLDQESTFQGHYSKAVFQTLYFVYRSRLWAILLLLVVGLIGRFLLLSNANLIGMWVDTFCQAPAVCRPVPAWLQGYSSTDFLRLLVVVTSLGFVATAGFRMGFSRLSAAAISSFYDEVTLRTSRFPIKFYDTTPVGRVVTRFSSDYGNVFRLFGGPLADFIAIIFDLSSMFVLVVFASPYYIPIFVVIGFLNYVVYRLNRERLRKERRDLSSSRSPSIAHFSETTQGAGTIRIFARQSTFFARFKRMNDEFIDQKLRTSVVVLWFSQQMSSMSAVLLLVTGVAGYGLVKEGLLSVGSVGVAFTFIILSGTSMQMFFEWMAQFEEAMTGVERLDDYLRRPLEPGLKLPAMAQYPTAHPFRGAEEEKRIKNAKLVSGRAAAVTVEDLWLRYGDDLPWVLKGLSFSIRPGEKIGLIGRTGSGKTSFVQALFQLYPFAKGRILIDGHAAHVGLHPADESSCRQADLAVYRRAIALISQEPTIFRGSLRENLDLAGVATEAQLRDALERVGLAEWFAHQSAGFETLLEERGRNLSAGEKQLLCMARCLLQEAPIVVMDEATSSVDPQSEEIMVRATKEFFADRTQIIIAHRLSTLDHCDRVLWLHKGEVRMFDKPEKVLPVFAQTRLAF